MSGQKKFGGKRGKRTKKSTTEEISIKHVPICEENQRYAYVTKMLGGSRLLANSADGKERQCHIPGKFKGKRYWISIGMLVLLNIREYQDNKSDIIYIYNADETKRLQRKGELRCFINNEAPNKATLVFEEEDDPCQVEISIDDL